MTDNTDSILVKMFVSTQKQADFDEHIKRAPISEFRETAEFDSFEKMNVIMAQKHRKRKRNAGG